MSELLFLAHRIPYPPNKGDKIRSYHILRYLAERYRVHLGAFVDDPDDWQHAGALEKICATVKLVPLDRRTALLRSATGLLRGEALGMPFYRDSAMREWVEQIQQQKQISGVFVFSSTMTQYLGDLSLSSSVLDLCDVDSEKWAQYAERHRFPMNWVYRREARLLASAERDSARRFRSVLLVSQAEADLFVKVAPLAKPKTFAMRNGVDTDYFDPSRHYDNPFKADEQAIVFTGAMDYWANADAVQWFANEMLPLIAASNSRVRFYIVGSRPSTEVMQLATLPNVVVTGTVPDVRPYLSHASVIVAPLRIARGIQNKVLEALAMAKAVVATAAALDGLDGVTGAGALSKDQAVEFASAVNTVLIADNRERGALARRYVCERYGWDASLQMLDRLLAPASIDASADAAA